MSRSRANLVAITEETAKDFLPAKFRKDRSIDLKKLAGTARNAIEGSEKSLAAAGDIANSNWLARLWNSGAFAKNVVESIGYIRDISQVNLALSAICNDLAAVNLQHARKIDGNHYETSRQLHELEQLTRGLLEHLQTARESQLLQPIVLGLGEVDGADKDALHGWLHSFSEAIDQQYLAMQARVDQLAQQPTISTDELAPIRQKLNRLSSAIQDQRDQSDRVVVDLKRVDEGLRNLDAENALQRDKLATRITHQTELAAERSQALDATLRQSHQKLSEALQHLNQRLGGYQSQLLQDLEVERNARADQDASVLDSVSRLEQALRRTINALNQHWLKRLFWMGGALLLVQIAGFGYLASHIGLWK